MSNDRRDFLKKTLFAAVGSAVLLPILSAQAQERRRSQGGGDDLPLVQPGTGMAASVNYQHKKSDIKDPKLKTERGGVPFEKQTCANCMLYTKHGMKNGGETGKCTLFANQVVMGEGWCGSWAKKA